MSACDGMEWPPLLLWPPPPGRSVVSLFAGNIASGAWPPDAEPWIASSGARNRAKRLRSEKWECIPELRPTVAPQPCRDRAEAHSVRAVLPICSRKIARHENETGPRQQCAAGNPRARRTAQMIRKLWIQVRSSLWFVPLLLVLAGLGLGLGLVQVDIAYGSDWKIDDEHPILGAGSEGSRAMLAAIAGSVITVAGVAFSVTIVTLSLASTQYSPRILRHFMSDRWNQFVLGTFVGIFVYCLVVMRTIRTGSGDGYSFVPLIAVFGGVVLALVSIACLILFIHHTASSIQASTILAEINRSTCNAITRAFPDEMTDGEALVEPEAEIDNGSWQPVESPSSGYVQTIDHEVLLRFACDRGIVLRAEREIGDFVMRGAPLLSVNGELKEADATTLCRSVAIGDFRDIGYDPGFGIRQMVDMALNALSPSVNDTSTAVSCLDYLSSVLSLLASRRPVSRFRTDEHGAVRLIAPAPDFDDLVAKAMDEIRLSTEGNVTILLQLLCALGRVGDAATVAERKRPLIKHAALVLEVADRTVPQRYDRERINDRLASIIPKLQPAAGELVPLSPERDAEQS
jgi:uncharacterized membrane protein